MVEFGPETTVM